MASKIFVNLPVKNLNKSIEFFTKLGFSFNQQFTDETATTRWRISRARDSVVWDWAPAENRQPRQRHEQSRAEEGHFGRQNHVAPRARHGPAY